MSIFFRGKFEVALPDKLRCFRAERQHPAVFFTDQGGL
jgi:hypothetical protein